MGNMSYCQFQNTSPDLGQCADAIEDEGLPDSKRELLALRHMLGDCQRILDAVDPDELDEAIEAALPD